ncbi:hypothetical protein ScPMuIL_003250 [Solemya velum]
MPKKYRVYEDALCCCEYENMEGERSHILQCCCDCQALDELFDRFITCRGIPSSTHAKLWATVEDRCRLPGLLGGGARKLNLDVVVPVFAIPLFILIGTHSLTATILILISIPIFMLIFYESWRKLTNKSRTRFFFVWGLTSLVLMVIVFEVLVVSYREILLWENILLSSCVVVLFYYIVEIRRNPGILKTTVPVNGRKEVKLKPVENGWKSVAIDMLETANGDVNRNVLDNFPADKVTWVDSRPIKDGHLNTWCESCQYKRPARSGHCSLCSCCIAVRDHHCVWIDTCIGARNHRGFITVLLLFIFCGYYGTLLTMTTICTPEMYMDWFLLPNDCQFIYSDFINAICFVSACYTILVTILATLLFVYQLILISQNVTSQELHMASISGKTRLGLIAVNNINNHGIFRNWFEFLTKTSRKASLRIVT